MKPKTPLIKARDAVETILGLPLVWTRNKYQVHKGIFFTPTKIPLFEVEISKASTGWHLHSLPIGTGNLWEVIEKQIKS